MWPHINISHNLLLILGNWAVWPSPRTKENNLTARVTLPSGSSKNQFAATYPQCLCLYGQSCWPSQSAFAKLTTSLSSPDSLVHPRPVGSPCYSSNEDTIKSEHPALQYSCSEVLLNFSNASWRVEQPGAYENVNFEAYIDQTSDQVESCPVPPSASNSFSCDQGSIPPLGVLALTVSDVQVAVSFAKEYNLKVVVKNTGHDYLGRSAGKGGFMIWTHALRHMVFHDEYPYIDTQTGKNETTKAVTLGAGTLWRDAYAFANLYNRILVGGLSVGGTVGAAGGWLSGGGHSVLSPRYGLGVDNALAISLVLANGTHVTTSSHPSSHPDLFWALRGGGGGTFGVVSFVTYRTYPDFDPGEGVTMASFQATLPHSRSRQEEAVGALFDAIKGFTDLGWGGYVYILPVDTPFPIPKIPSKLLTGIFLAPNTSLERTEELFAPFASRLRALANGLSHTTYTHTSSYYSWFYDTFIKAEKDMPWRSQVGRNQYIASRLLPREMVGVDLRLRRQAINAILGVEGVISMNVVAGGQVSGIPSSSAGLNPSWRHALAEVIVGESWSSGASVSEISKAVEKLKRNTEVLEGVSTDGGSYLNEGSLFEKDFKKTYFGAHYDRLREIKTKYDPESMFVVKSGVGSDEWDEELDCRLDK